MSDLDAIKFLLDASYNGAKSKLKNQIEQQKQESEMLKNRVADLEAKLAESEEKCKKAYREGLLQKQFDKDMEIDQLKQQLAECEKESNDYVMSAIETNVDLKNRLTQAQKERELDNAFWKQECDSLQKALEDKDKEIEELKQKVANAEHERHEEWKTGKEWKWEWQKTNRLLEEANQAKTDFAIERLLIVRSRVHNFRYNESRCLNKEDSIEDCLEVLDQQIKELKGK